MPLNADCFLSIFTFMFHSKEVKPGNCRRCHLAWLKPEEPEEGHLRHIYKLKFKMKILRNKILFFLWFPFSTKCLVSPDLIGSDISMASDNFFQQNKRRPNCPLPAMKTHRQQVKEREALGTGHPQCAGHTPHFLTWFSLQFRKVGTATGPTHGLCPKQAQKNKVSGPWSLSL